jgi:hypothetical protein
VSHPPIAVTRTADGSLEDDVRQSPVDREQERIRRVVKLVVAPWLWCVAVPWLTSGTLGRFSSERTTQL